MIQALNLSGYLAEQVLKERFLRRPDETQREKEILSYCRKNYAPVYAQKIAFRLQRRHINHINVDSVLADLPELHRQIFLRKYKKQEMLPKISIDLNLTIWQIFSIDRAVQKNIQNMLLYMLTAHDVYSRLKVANMVHILDLQLGFLEDSLEFASSVNRDWIASLVICREKYRQLYSAMETILKKSNDSWHCNILAVKLRQPNLTSKEISSICKVSQSGVNRHFRAYKEEISPYIVSQS